jgi:RluA family pseudouridine synthase
MALRPANGEPGRTDWAGRVLFQDAKTLVIDKPAGLAVHPGPKTPHSLEQQLADLRFGLRGDPQPVHRLDRDTSGCLVLGRTPAAVRQLAALFATGSVAKTYWAVVAGTLPEPDGVIDRPLRKVSSRTAGWRMVVDPTGQRALTRWRVLGSAEGATLVELTPETGRTHQLRIHLASLGCPIVGDPVYGRAGSAMLLHARALSLPLPWEPAERRVEAPLPAHFPDWTRGS